MECYILNGEIIESHKKVLFPQIATSILVDKALLKKSQDLVEIHRGNGENSFFRVKGENVCIMHVEKGFCILVDYKINGIDLPSILKESKYGVYQYGGRDWIRRTSTQKTIGHDIKKIIYGGVFWGHNDELDHMAETFNELEKNKQFIKAHLNAGESHRRRIVVADEGELIELVKRIRANKGKPGGTMI